MGWLHEHLVGWTLMQRPLLQETAGAMAFVVPVTNKSICDLLTLDVSGIKDSHGSSN